MSANSERAASGSAIIHKPCSFNQNGATQDSCDQMTRSAQRNLSGCVPSRCRSPRRVCRACVAQSGEPAFIVNYVTGLCAFHTEHGERAQRPAPKLPPVDLAWARQLREARQARSEGRPIVVGADLPIVQKTPLPEITRLPAAVKGMRRSFASRSPSGRRHRGISGIKVHDLERGLSVRMEPFAVLTLIEQLRALEQSDTQIQGRLKLHPATFGHITRLSRITSEVRERMTDGKIPMSMLIYLSALRPEYQMETATQIAEGRISAAGLKQLLRDPTKKVPKRHAKRPTRVRRGHESAGQVSVTDRATRQRVRKHALEVMRDLLQLTIEENLSTVNAAEVLGLTANKAFAVMRLNALIPEVQQLMVEGTPRLAMVSAVHIALLVPELQLETAQKVISGKLTIADLRAFAAVPEHRAVRTRRPRSTAARTPRTRGKRFPKALLVRVEHDVVRLEKAVDAMLNTLGVVSLQEGIVQPETEEALATYRERIRNKLRLLRIV